MVLVIMAAGMGSRFGGLKQIEPVGEHGEFILDYSIYDAIKVGFTKVIFIIKEENYDVFRETVGKRIENKINVEYVFQKMDNIPDGYEIPKGRIKPWGTAHAILCCKDVVDENFAVINADDFYGRDAYFAIGKFLNENTDNNLYAMVGYKVKNTLTENGAVKRGVCKVTEGYLTNLVESSIETINDEIVASSLDGRETFKLNENDTVSMNIWVFSKNIFSYLEKRFLEFLDKNKNNLEKCEYLIPDVVFEQVSYNLVNVKVLSTNAIWHGITYKDDKDSLVNAIKILTENNEYPTDLWK